MSESVKYQRNPKRKATAEHLELSTFIKDVHKQLRRDTKEHGWEETWSKHKNDAVTLKRYATTMESLSREHWHENENQEASQATSRIKWVHEKCQEYFQAGIFKARLQEEEIAKKCDWSLMAENNLVITGSLKLLDVGSCYNPFQQYKDYQVVAIDIAPSSKDVLQCDFLNIEGNDGVQTLYNNSYDIVVFSLLLDYLPRPELRLKCCQNAYNVLKFEGILLIISPDAKHVGANSKYMKSWRKLLATIGFRRICYEKTKFLHHMIFRKTNNPNVARRWADMHNQDDFMDKMYIPQDFQDE